MSDSPVHRAHLQNDLIHLWNRCDRQDCGLDYQYHPGGEARHDRSNPCMKFVPAAGGAYLSRIEVYERGGRDAFATALDDNVGIAGVQRSPMGMDDWALASRLRLELPPQIQELST